MLGRDKGGVVRVTGYADFVGNDTEPIPERKSELIQKAKDLFGEDSYDESEANHWVGVRPVSADDIPIIGKSSKFKNLYWNTGHGARGVTCSLGSGKILGHLLHHDEIDKMIIPDVYAPKRFLIYNTQAMTKQLSPHPTSQPPYLFPPSIETSLLPN